MQLQTRDLELIESHQFILSAIKKLTRASTQANPEIEALAKEKRYKKIGVSKAGGIQQIERKKFFNELADRIRTRSISTIYRKGMSEEAIENCRLEYVEMFRFLNLVDKKNFP